MTNLRPPSRRLHRRVVLIGRTATVVRRTLGPAESALALARRLYSRVGLVAHRARYLPLAVTALGALMVSLGPKPHSLGEVLGDDSMAPGLAVGQAVNINRGPFVAARPRVGEVVTFHPPVGEFCSRRPPRGSACPFVASARQRGEGIKRIVASPGDWVALNAGRLIRAGRRVDEPYNRWPCVSPSVCDLPRAVKLPLGTWWLLADNRNATNDSRRYGPIPTAWISGLVVQRRPFVSTEGPLQRRP